VPFAPARRPRGMWSRCSVLMLFNEPAGTLSYAFNPTSPLRDSIFVSLAFISASRKHRTFHIDGGTTVYHCKALTVRPFSLLLQADPR